jgi:hypothetical protein
VVWTTAVVVEAMVRSVRSDGVSHVRTSLNLFYFIAISNAMSDATPEGPGDSATHVNNAPVTTRQAL